jgi:hypothetical protein
MVRPIFAPFGPDDLVVDTDRQTLAIGVDIFAVCLIGAQPAKAVRLNMMALFRMFRLPARATQAFSGTSMTDTAVLGILP